MQLSKFHEVARWESGAARQGEIAGRRNHYVITFYPEWFSQESMKQFLRGLPRCASYNATHQVRAGTAIESLGSRVVNHSQRHCPFIVVRLFVLVPEIIFKAG